VIYLLTAFFFFAMLTVVYFDFRRRIIPNEVLIGIAAIGILAVPYTAITWQVASVTAVGALVLGFMAWKVAPGLLGAADAKLGAVLGIWIGAWGLWYVLLMALFGLVVMSGMVYIARKNGGMSTLKTLAIPVGGLMAVAAIPAWWVLL
jgi:leader peptidase (prepilin peptidase) / N-methyltransferase